MEREDHEIAVETWYGSVISIISPMGGDGRTTMCANVGAALANLGKETIAVDADIVLRQLSVVTGLANRIAFSWIDVMEADCDISIACVRHRNIPGLQLLPVARHGQDMVVMENMKAASEIIGRACYALR